MPVVRSLLTLELLPCSSPGVPAAALGSPCSPCPLPAGRTPCSTQQPALAPPFPPLPLEGLCFQGLFKEAPASLVWVYQPEIKKDWFNGLSLRLEACGVEFKSDGIGDILCASKSV